MMKRLVLLIALIIQAAVAFTQLTDIGSSGKSIFAKRYFRIHYDNDFLVNTDHYYTQGITLEWVHPRFGDWPSSKLLYRLKESQAQWGLGFDLFGYTPTLINSDSILYGDRPFAAGLSLKLFATSTGSRKGLRSVSALGLGVIGPAALGKEIQTNIHRWTGNKLPKGWQHQVRNDIVLNYQLNMEKKLISTDPFILSGSAELRAGTLHNRIGAGLNFIAGHFNDPFQAIQKKKTSYWLFGQTQLNCTGYDATLQGGLFNRQSPYTIPAKDITRITFRATAGIVLNFQKIHFSYSQSFITKEFRTGLHHRWGGLTAGFIF